MSIKYDTLWSMICDRCEQELVVKNGDFSDLVFLKIEAQWVSLGMQRHVCIDCQTHGDFF